MERREKSITMAERVDKYGRIDFVKVDVESAEWEFWKSASPVLPHIKAWDH